MPVEDSIREKYEREIGFETETRFPFWARIWPAAIAVSEFLQEHIELVKGKEVLELAAGLGLPSMVAAQFAKTVITSDYDPGAVEMLRNSIALNNLENVEAAEIDWNYVPGSIKPELVLLSDVNYQPADFEKLQAVIHNFVSGSSVVILCTPHRYSAASFVEKILPLVVHREAKTIVYNGHSAQVTVFILAQGETRNWQSL